MVTKRFFFWSSIVLLSFESYKKKKNTVIHLASENDVEVVVENDECYANNEYCGGNYERSFEMDEEYDLETSISDYITYIYIHK